MDKLCLLSLLLTLTASSHVNANEDVAEAAEKKFVVVGDMRFDEFRYKLRHLPEDSDLVSTGILSTYYRWPKNSTGYVNVPYLYSTVFTSAHKTIISAGMNLISSKTCVRFVPKTLTDKSYINIIDDDGCYSYVGRLGGGQDVSLARFGCIYPEIVAHEMMHALGFDHMHSHASRDSYLQVFLGNVSSADRSQFDKVSPLYYGNFNTSYDFKSIMHYDRKAFSINGLDTMLPLPANIKYKDSMGNGLQLSFGDITRINNMYACIVR